MAASAATAATASSPLSPSPSLTLTEEGANLLLLVLSLPSLSSSKKLSREVMEDPMMAPFFSAQMAPSPDMTTACGASTSSAFSLAEVEMAAASPHQSTSSAPAAFKTPTPPPGTCDRRGTSLASAMLASGCSRPSNGFVSPATNARLALMGTETTLSG